MNWKKITKALLFPPVIILLLLTAVCGAGLAWIFLKDMSLSWQAYGLYALSFYTLCADCVYMVLVFPKQYRRIRQRIMDNPLGNRYLTDRVFRTTVSLHVSLGINLAYVVLNGLSWYFRRSWWFVVLGVYYLILSVMRFLLCRQVHRQRVGSDIVSEWKRSWICGYILLLLNLFLSSAVLMILYQDKGFDYPGVLIYVMALYAFYAVIHAVVDMIRYRKLGSPLLSTVKTVSLSSALVSMLSLETAMLSQFGGEMAEEGKRLLIIFTGVLISVIVVSLAVLRIRQANRALKSMKENKEHL